MTVSSESRNIYSSLLKLFLFICLLPPSSQKFQKMTYDNIHQWSYVPDNIHHFIVLDQQLLPLLQQSPLPQTPSIEYFTHDCSKNNTILRTCQGNPLAKIVFIFNKVIVEFENWQHQKLEKTGERVRLWIQGVVEGGAKRNLGERGILDLLGGQGQVFILVQNRTIYDLEMGYNVLAKQFYYKDFIYFADLKLAQQYNLTIGTFLHIKSFWPLGTRIDQSLLQILSNSSMTTYFPSQTTKRYDILKIFVFENIYTRGFDKRIENIEQQRFNIKVRKLQQNGQYSSDRNVIVFCDLGVQCRRYFGALDEQIRGKGIVKGNSVKRIFYRHEMIRNVQIMEIFFHLKLRNLKLPFVLILSGEDPAIPHLPLRFAKQFSYDSQKPLQQLTVYLADLDQGKIPNTYFSSGIPKKNGFTGKGAQKRVQKLSYETYKKQISQALSQKKFYLLFISAFDFNCEQCSTFYTEYKKLASFLQTEENSNTVLGVFDLSKDQIDMKEMSGVPSVLFFGPNKGLYRPVQYERRYDFEEVLKFIKNQKIIDQKGQEKIIKPEKIVEEPPREVFETVLPGEQIPFTGAQL